MRTLCGRVLLVIGQGVGVIRTTDDRQIQECRTDSHGDDAVAQRHVEIENVPCAQDAVPIIAVDDDRTTKADDVVVAASHLRVCMHGQASIQVFALVAETKQRSALIGVLF